MRTNGYVVFAAVQLPCGMHSRWATVAECERLVQRGECTKVSQPGKKSIGRTRPVYRLVPQAEPSKSVPTPASLGWVDTYINLGIDPRPHREDGLSHARIADVRMKVREFGRCSPRQVMA